MAERQALEQQLQRQIEPPQLQSPSQQPREDMLDCVMHLENALLPCLPARELQAIDRSPHPSHQSKHPFISLLHSFRFFSVTIG